MSKKWLVSVLAAVAVLFSAGATAQTMLQGAYVGLDIGNADFGSEDDTAFKLFGGFKFHPNFAVELAYSQLVDKGPAEATAIEVDAVGFFPLAPQLNILGKLGFARISNGEDENEFTFGVGIQYDVTRQIGARLQWQRYTTDPDVDLITIGVLFQF
jgi:OOP family OmpA-OmpF porin